ncbi:MAG: hypothetical protein AMJ90_06285 [candidate division Zixibacteria bacterium SM23_73_2]|nr:MAG: hypothetical protein AMJ90_06285 [candidate division Zixibacteria bacterium SM23_73_2]
MDLVKKHRWDVSLDQAKKIQEKLSKHVIKEDDFKELQRIGGVGVAFGEDGEIAVTVVVFSFPQLEFLEKIIKKGFSNFAYKPGFFAFSVSPLIISCLKKIENIDLLIFPGRGIFHPRGLGMATHLGVLFDLPTVACSKTPLLGGFKEPEKVKGSFSFIEKKGGRVGAVLRSKDNTNPIFVTPGHKISSESTVNIILKCCTRFRFPEPLRQARILAKRSV